MIGQRLSRYEVLEKVGEGGMGEVFLARDVDLGREIALKVLPGDVAGDSEHLERFRREARTVAALNHPNVVTVHSVEEVDGVSFMTMELVQGRDLEEVVPEGGLPTDAFLDLALQMTEAVAAAHELGITHRDLKPSNVMVSERGTIKVLDFGLAKRRLPFAGDGVTGRTIDGLTMDGRILGTVSYMAPERWEGKPADPRSDIFSLGVILYEMATGTYPFDGQSNIAVMSSIMTSEPRSVAVLRSGFPPRLVALIDQCLAKNPDERPTASVLVEKLRRLRTEGYRSAQLRLPARPVLAAGLGLAAVAAVAGVLLLDRPMVTRIVEPRLISSLRGSQSQASFSPDGTRIAFTGDFNGIDQIWIRQVDRGEAVLVTEDPEPAGAPSWSPVEDVILYHRVGGGIWSIAALGGQPRLLAESGVNPSWHPDGDAFVYERGNEVWTARSDGSDQRRVEHVPASPFAAVGRFPAFSPDGRWIAYFEPERGALGDFWIAGVDTDELRRVTDDVALGGSPIWTPGGAALVASFAPTGSRTLWRIPVDGGDPIPLTTGSGEDDEPDINRDGTRLIYTNFRWTHHLLMLDPRTGVRDTVANRRTDIPFPTTSPDGSKIAFFMQDELDDFHVFWTRRSTGEIRQVTSGQGEMNTMPFWSGDGSSIYFYRVAPEPGLYRVPENGDRAPVLVESAWQVTSHPAVREDPSGRYMVYSSVDQWRPLATSVRDMQEGGEVALAVPIRTPEWSTDGTRIVGVDSAGVATVCPADGSPCTSVAPAEEVDWAADGQRLYLLRASDRPLFKDLWVVGVDGSGETRVGQLGPFRSEIDVDFDVGPDDVIVWTESERSDRELWVADVG